MQSCGTCKHLRVPKGQQVLKHAIYPCDAPMPDMPILPRAATKATSFRWPPVKVGVTPGDGAYCGTYVERVKEEETQ